MTFSQYFEALGDFDWLAILAGTVAMFIVGWLWYGPLFGKKWGAANGVANPGSGMPGGAMLIKGFIQTLAINIGIAYVIFALHAVFQNEPTIETLFMSSFVVAIWFIGAAFYGGVIYLKRSTTAFLIDTGYYLVGITVAAFVQDMIAS